MEVDQDGKEKPAFGGCDRRDVTHAMCGLTTVKLRSSRFGAIGSTCLESVVAFCVFARKDLRYA